MLPIMEQWLNGKIIDIPPCELILATIVAQCNLRCKHCYWPHRIVMEPSIREWETAIEQIKTEYANAPVIYAGRILNPVGEQFIKTYCEKTGNKIGIIDHGFFFLEYEHLLPYYEQIAISIDGVREAHDLQRGRAGAFDRALHTVLELKNRGCDPIISACLSKITLDRWEEFERLVEDHEILFSTTLCWNLAGTESSAVLSDEELKIGFQKLVGGTTKLINLYDTKHIRVIADTLKTYRWRIEGTHLRAEFENDRGEEIHIVYRPESVLFLTEFDLLWDGKFYTHETVTIGINGRVSLADYLPEKLLQNANVMLREERNVWDAILPENF